MQRIQNDISTDVFFTSRQSALSRWQRHQRHNKIHENLVYVGYPLYRYMYHKQTNKYKTVIQQTHDHIHTSVSHSLNIPIQWVLYQKPKTIKIRTDRLVEIARQWKKERVANDNGLPFHLYMCVHNHEVTQINRKYQLSVVLGKPPERRQNL